MPNLTNLTPEIIKNYQEEISQNSSVATVKRKSISLNKFFDWAQSQGHIDTNPMKPQPVNENPYIIVHPTNYKKIGLRTFAILGVTTSLVIIIFLLLKKLPDAIQFIKTPAQEITTIDTPKIVKTPQKTTSPLASSQPALSANTAVKQSWNLYASLKLTDTNGTPLVGAQTITFKVFNSQTGGSALYESSNKSVTTDANGSALISLDSVPQNLFFENNKLYLEPQVAGTAMETRIPISTANVSANLNGYFPSETATEQTIPVIDADGSLVLASQSPAIKASSGNFLVEGQALTLKTADGTDGNIEINPDGKGITHFLFEGTGQNFLNAQAPNLTKGSLYYGIVANNATGYDLVRLQNGSGKPVTRFSIDSLGNTYMTGNETVKGSLSVNGIANGGSYNQTSGNFTVNQNVGDFASITKTGSALSDVMTLTLDERNKPTNPNSSYSTLVLNRYDGSNDAAALKVANGNAIFNGQVQLGRYAGTPNGIGQGSLVYNTSDNNVYVFDGTNWTSLGTGSGVAFNNIMSGTNTSATMLIGSGASLNFTGTGTINASSLNGLTSSQFFRNDTSTGSNGQILTTTAGVPTWTDITSQLTAGADISITGTTNATIANTSTLNSVTGRGATTVNTITVGNLIDSGLTASKLVFSDGSKQLTSTGTVPADQGGTGFSSYTVGDLLYADTTTTLAKLNDVATGNALISGGAGVAPSWSKIVLGTHTTGNYVSTIAGTANQIDASASTGNVTLSIPSDFRVPGTIRLNGITYTFPSTQSSNFILATDGSGTLTWADPSVVSAGSNYWNLSSGLLFPKNSSSDTLFGGDSTASAKFAFINTIAGTPTASISGTTANVNTYLTGNGNLATTNMNHLTLGGTTTGQVDIANDLNLNSGKSLLTNGTTRIDTSGNFTANNLIVNGNVASNLIPSVNNTYDLGSVSNKWANIYATSLNQNGNNVCDTSGNCANAGAWAQGSGIVYTNNNTSDVLIGSNSTSSAKFAFTGVSSGTPTATVSGTYLTADGTLQTTKMQHLTLGGTTTGQVDVNNNLNVSTGNAYQINGNSVLNSTTLGSSVVSSSLTQVGTLTTGSIASGFGSILTTNGITGGTLTSTGTTTFGGLTYTWPATQSTNYVLTTDGSGTLSWTDPSAAVGASIYWTQANGVLNPKNNTVDVLIGSDSTGSAKFAFTGVNGGTPTASVSGTYLTSTGNLSNTSMRNLTLGSSTTGNVIINSRGQASLTANGANLTTVGTFTLPNGNTISGQPNFTQFSNGVSIGNGTTYYFNSLGDINSNGLTVNGTTNFVGKVGSNVLPLTNNTYDLGSATFKWANVYATAFTQNGNTVCDSSDNCLVNGPWVQGAGVLNPKNNTVDVLIGANSTGSAKFAFTGVNSGTPTASVSGTYLTSTGNLETTKMQHLTLGGTTTGQVDVNNNLNVSTGNGYLINNASVLSSNTLGSGVVNSSLTQVGALTSGSIASGFGSILTTNGITGGTLTSTGTTTFGGITYTWPGSQSTNYVLSTDGSGTLSWVDPSAAVASTIYWTQANGVLNPKNSSVDVLIGSNSTGSAKFAFTGVNSGTPTASVSGTYLTSTGNLATTNMNHLTLGGSTTGQVDVSNDLNLANTKSYLINNTSVLSTTTLGSGVINSSLTQVGALTSGSIASGFGSILTTNGITGGTLTSTGTTTFGGIAYTWPVSQGSNYVLQNNGSGTLSWVDANTTVNNYWNQVSGALYNRNNTVDFLLGSDSTGSAKFAITGVNSNSPTATLSGTYLTADGNLANTNMEHLTLGGSTTGQVDVNNNLNVSTGNGYLINNTSVLNSTTLGSSVVNSSLTSVGTLGSLTVSGTTSFNGIAYTWPASQTTNYVLQTNGAGTLSWVDPASAVSSTIYWTQAQGVLNPKNNTVDVLIGANSTGSAKFAFTGVNSGTPTASVSGTYLTSTGNLTTTNMQHLTLGGNTTGQVDINNDLNLATGKALLINNASVLSSTTLGSSVVNSSLTSVGTLGSLTVSGTTTFNGLAYTWPASQTNNYVLTSNGSGTLTWTDPNALVSGSTYWNQAQGAVFTKNNSVDFLLGSNSTSSAKFAVTGINSNSPTATISGTYLTADGNLANTSMKHLTLGGTTTGQVDVSNDLNLATGKALLINGTSVLNTNTLGSGVINSSLTSVGALTTGSIASGFGSILTTNGITGGTLTSTGTTTFGGLTYTWPGSQTTNYVLTTNGAGTLSWTDPSVAVSASIYWTQANGVLNPKNNTVDVLIGANSTGSAKFAFTGVNSGTPTASISGTYLTSTGNLATTNMQHLTLGGTTTGQVDVNNNLNVSTGNGYLINNTSVLSSNTLGSGVVNSSLTSVGALASGSIANGFGTISTSNSINGSSIGTNSVTRIDNSGNLTNIGTTQLNGITYTWPASQSTSYILQTNGSGTLSWVDPNTVSASTIYWNQANGILYPKNNTVDVLIGSTSSQSAKFAFTGVNSGTPTASVSGTYLTSTGNLANTSMRDLTLGGATTGQVILNSRGSNALIANGLNLTAGGTITLPSSNVITGLPNFVQFDNGVSVGAGTTYYFDSAGNINANAGTYAGNVAINGGSLTTSVTGTANLFNANATTLNIGGAATAVKIGATNVALTLGGNSTIYGGNNSNGTLTLSSTSNATKGNIQFFTSSNTIDENGNLTLAGTATVNGNTVLGNAITDTIDFQGRVLQDSDLIPVGTTGTNDLGTALLPWDNLYATNVYQNGNLVCDSAGTNCPVQFNLWGQGNGALYPNSNSVDLLIGSSATASAKFAIVGVNSGTPTATLSGTYLTSAGNLANTSMKDITLGGATTGNVIANSPLQVNSLTASKGVFTDANKKLTSTGVLGTDQGGTGLSSYATGDLIYASATNTLSNLADVATGNVLISGGVGTAPSWGKVTLGTHTTGNYVSTITGTANQITASASTGDITLSIPSDFRAPGTVNAVNGLYTGATAGTQRIDASGNLTNIGTTQLNGITYTWPASQTNTYVLQTNGSGTLSWVDPTTVASSTIYWTQANGVLNPKNNTVDVLIGANSTGSAKFAFTGVNSGTPTASISGTYLTADGNLANTSMKHLTLGGSTTGQVDVNNNLNVSTGNGYLINNTSVLSSNTLGSGVVNSSLTQVGALASGSIANGFGTIATANTITGTVLNGTTSINTGAGAGTVRIDVNGNVTANDLTANGNTTLGDATSDTISYNGRVNTNILPSVTATDDLGSSSLKWNNVYAVAFNQNGNTVCDSSGNCPGATNYWNSSNGAVFTTNNSVDLLIGSSATASAKFAITGVVGNSPTATLSGTYLTSAGNLANTSMKDITLGGSTTGNVIANSPFTAGSITDTGLTASKVVFTDANKQLTSTGTVGANQGGTGFSTYAVGDLLYADSTSTLAKLADVATGKVLKSGGVNTAPAWGDAVLSLAGTANQITASASTGDITLSIPSDFRAPGTVNAVNGIYTGAGAGTQRIDASGNVTTNNLTVNGNVASNLIPSTNNTYDLGSSGVKWANVYATAFTQNGNTVCDSSGNCPGSTNYWGQTNGVVYPINSSVDLLIGASATGSAKFAFTGVNSGTPTASISGTYLTSTGNLATTNMQHLTLGGTTTGQVDVANDLNLATGKALLINNASVLNSTTLGSSVVNSSLTQVGALASGSIANGFGTITTANTITGTVLNGTTSINTGAGAGTVRIDVNGNVTANDLTANGNTTLGDTTSDTITFNGRVNSTVNPSANNTYDLGSLALKWANVYATSFNQNGNTVCDSSLNCQDKYWQLNNNILSPGNSTYDLTIGGTATGSAFQVFGIEKTTGDIAKINSTVITTGNLFEATASAITSGNILKLGNGGDSGNFTGNGILMDFDNTGGSSFTGNFLKLDKGGSNIFAINSSGDITTTGDLTLTPAGGQVYLTDTDTLNVGGITGATYNAFANSSDSPSATNITADNDLFVGGDLEIKSGLYLTGKNIYNVVGGVSTTTVALASDPSLVNSFNFLGYGSWLIQNNTNNGIASLMVDQIKNGDIFTASASGVAKFTIDKTGNITNAGTSANFTFSGSGNHAISNSTAATNLTIDAGTSGLIQIGNTSTGNIELAGGSTGTGCTVANATGTLTCSADMVSAAATASLFNSTTTNLSLGGAATTFAIGPTGSSGSITLSGGSADTGCTIDGTTGNLTCSGNISTVATTGTQGWWQLTNKILSPANSTYDLSVGANSTASAKLQAFGTESLAGDLLKLNSTVITTGNLFEATSSAITSGNIIKLGQGGNTSFTGTGITMDFDNTGGGSFTGKFLSFKNNTTQVFAIDSNGKLVDQYVTAGIAVGATNETALAGFGATSIVGALNELKNTNKNISHNDYVDWANIYLAKNEGTLTNPNGTPNGLFFDTFSDSTKIDGTNSTSSGTIRVSDNSYRVGLTGGQTYNSATNDNDSHAYLGSNTVNDIYFYDRTKDSKPEVQVELGIDPNWYNGVTLGIATSSAQYSQNGTVATKNPNLTTSYNGSLIKVTGTDATPRTIYITIKTPTTFDWTNYQGDAATGVTITPGIAQTLGATGVSATFTETNYNVGDVFQIASWYIEASSSTRGAKQAFPERSNIITTTSSVDIIDSDTQKLWMRFSQGTDFIIGQTAVSSGTMLNGKMYVGSSGGSGLREADFTTDRGNYISTSAQFATGIISLRNTQRVSTITNSLTLLNATVNDVDAIVIPNQPTQQINSSGWGYIIGNGTASIYDSTRLPYTYNSTPNVNISISGAKSTTAPTSLDDCTSNGSGNSAQSTSVEAYGITNSDFNIHITNSNATALSATVYYCYSWSATGIVSPKQFVAAATGASAVDGAMTIINETDGTKADVDVGSQTAGVVRASKVALANNTMYNAQNYEATPDEKIQVYYGVHGLQSETSFGQYRSGQYRLQNQASSWSVSGPTILGTYPANDNLKSLYVTAGTSTIQPGSNTIYVGTTTGLTVIQEKQGSEKAGLGSVESGGSAKYYTKDYVSEEMIGDIRGMWPLNNSNTSSDFEDISIKADPLTGTNITAGGDSIAGVRNTATDFDGTTEYMSCTDVNCGGTSKLDYTGSGSWSIGAWVNPASVSGARDVITKATTGDLGYELLISSGVPTIQVTNTAGSWDAIRNASMSLTTGTWYHIVAVYTPSTNLDIYVNGVLVNGTLTGTIPSTIRNSGANFVVGATAVPGGFFSGYIDEAFVTSTSITSGQVKNMYQVGYRALQSHSTSLGSSSANSQQQLGYISTGTNVVGAVAVDSANQYMYVGLNSTTLGGLSKIQLNSDTNIKTYTASTNVPSGGTNIVDEDVTSLGVGYQLEAVGSAASGVKSMAPDNNANRTVGSLFSKTQTLASGTKFAYLWTNFQIDSSDATSSINVYACNSQTTQALCTSNNAWVLGTIVQTDSTQNTPEREYSFSFPTAGTSMTFKFDFKRGSTKTNTYIERYGSTWASSVGGADIAERYQSTEPVYPGDILAIDSPPVDGEASVKLSRTNYDSKLIGIVTTNPGIVMDNNLVDLNFNAASRNSPNRPAVALAGRVPVRVSTKNGNILVGDPITSSDIAGVGIKSTKAGNIVGKALESFACEDSQNPCEGKIMVLVNVSWFDPDVYLTSTGDLKIISQKDATPSGSTTNFAYKIIRITTDGLQEVVDRIGTFGELVAGNIKAGSILTQDFVTENLVAKVTKVNLVTPLDGSTDVAIQIGSESTPSGKLAIKNAQNEEVASIDNLGNASFAGTVRSQNIDEIQSLLTQIQADQGLLSQVSETASPSAVQNLDSLTVNDVYFTNQITGLDFSITGNSINSLATPLKIQSLGMANIELMAGLITIDTNGNVNISGNLNVAGKITTPTAEIKDITVDNFTIANAIDASNSGEVVGGILTSNATAGKAVVPAGTTEITIKNNKVNDYTLVYTTPTSDTSNNVLYIKSKEVGQFVIGFTNALTTDVNFNWWIVQIKQ